VDFRWNEWNVDHIVRHGVSPEEAETVVRSATRPFPRKIEDDKWLVWGRPGEADPQEVTMKQKPYWEMTRDELAEATKEFDAPLTIDKSRPLNRAERKQWERLKKKLGRPKVGAGFKRISVSIERGLLQRANRLARKRRVSRSKLIAQALEETLRRQTKTR